MRLRFILSAILVFASFLGYGSITINNITGSAYYNVHPPELIVRADVQSTYQLASVTASCDSSIVDLTYDPYYKFQGYCPLGGSPGDTLWLKVNAIDIFGNSQSDSVTFIRPPLAPDFLKVEEPLYYSVARPGFRFKCTITDPDSCEMHVDIGYPGANGPSYYPVFTGKVKGSLDTMLYVHSNETGMSGFVHGWARNSKGEYSDASSTIWIETSPFLSEIYQGKSLIQDFNYDKVLECNAYDWNNWQMRIPPPPVDTPSIIDIITKQENIIPFTGYAAKGFFLTPQGAVFSGHREPALSRFPEDTVYDYNNGSLLAIHTISRSGTNLAKGNTYIWDDYDMYPSTYYYLHIRNLITKQNDTLKLKLGSHYAYAIANNETIVFSENSGTTHNLFSYKQGILSQIPTGSQGSLTLADAQENNIMYIQYPSNYLYNGQTTIELGNYGGLLRGKYQAFYRNDIAGKQQVWLRDSVTSAETQITFFGTNSGLEELGDNGDVVFQNGSSRYLVKHNSQPVIISQTSSGKVYYRNQEWYIALGSVLYKIDLSLKPPVFNLLSFEARATNDKNLLEWSVEGATYVKHFQIEKSEDSLHFTSIDSLYPINSIYTTSYTYNDRFAKPVTNYYRLKIVNMDGSFVYSEIRSISAVPFRFISFTATNTGETDFLQWTMERSAALKGIEIQRSVDSMNFTVLSGGDYNPQLPNDSAVYSTWQASVPEISYYRLKFIKLDGTFEYSPIRLVQGQSFRVINFTATKSATLNLLEWSLVNATVLTQMEIERSGDNQHYSSISTEYFRQTNDSTGYQYEDVQRPPTINYYRIKFTKQNGAVEYSPIRSVNNSDLFTVIIYPNPAKDEVNISLPDLVGQTASVQLIDGNGTIYQQFTVTTGSIKLDIRGLPPGTYYIRITASGTTQVIKILVL